MVSIFSYLKRRYLVLFFLFSSALFSQNQYLKIDYIEEFGLKELHSSRQYKTELFLKDDQASLYRVDTETSTSEINSDKEGNGSDYSYKPSNARYLYYFNDLRNSLITYKWYIAFKKFYITDSPTFNWKLTSEFKDILGYKCQKATLEFRGRSYEAFFTNELGVKGGPWKFHNLPGAILEVYSVDDEFKIKAYQIKTIEAEELLISNPYSGEKTITWDEYKTLYTKKYQETKSIVYDNNVTSSMPVMNRELLVEENDR
ncbi:GLPGLI family protein [Robiginitalea marina]|uniref:GLPGLI family protein n=1 Tax=Robiginitalea marina TaxID=2954105 RepID=A0ABT1AZB3_9FLAO|nr:GLPGLI family protein [Robiginitalea marina]MCO5724987.1 GLPGLI family protein [Robiginitalea marina]